jgi:hypothetical protein
VPGCRAASRSTCSARARLERDVAMLAVRGALVFRQA